MNKKFSICVGICTKDRSEKIKKCLYSLNAQAKHINEIIITEDISNNKYLSKTIIKEIFPTVKRIKYITNKFKSIPKSRNLIISNVESEVLLFVDDDVIISKKSLQKVKSHFKVLPKTGILAGRLLPVNLKNSISNADCYYQNRERVLKKNTIELSYVPFSFVAINMHYVNKYSLLFNTNLNIGEDIDFSLKFSERKIPLYCSGEIKNYHYYNTSLLSFLKDRAIHGQYYVLLNNLHKNYYPIKYITHYNGLPIFLFPCFSILNSFKIVKESYPKINNKKVGFVLLLSEIISILSTSYYYLYSSIILFFNTDLE